MGQRITYYQSKSGKTLPELLAENYPAFRQWILKEQADSLKKYKENLISDELKFFLQKHPVLPEIDLLSQKIADELSFEFLLSYCDYGAGRDIFELTGPMMSTWRYQTAFEIIEKKGDAELHSLWNYLKTGRSVQNGEAFMGNGGEVIGFWTKPEMEILQEKLKKLPLLPGIEFVLSVLEELKNNANELVFNVER